MKSKLVLNTQKCAAKVNIALISAANAKNCCSWLCSFLDSTLQSKRLQSCSQEAQSNCCNNSADTHWGHVDTVNTLTEKLWHGGCRKLELYDPIKRHPEEQQCQADKTRVSSEIMADKKTEKKQVAVKWPFWFNFQTLFSLCLSFLILVEWLTTAERKLNRKDKQKTGGNIERVAELVKLKATSCSYGNTFTMEWSVHCRINEAEANLPFQYCSSARLDNNWMG